MFLRVPPDEVSLFLRAESVSLPDLGTQDPAALEGWKDLRCQMESDRQWADSGQGKDVCTSGPSPPLLSTVPAQMNLGFLNK